MFPAFHVVGSGTGYSEFETVESRRADKLVDEINRLWIYTHGTPEILSSDDEINRGQNKDSLKTSLNQFKQRKPRRRNKCGIVEREMGQLRGFWKSSAMITLELMPGNATKACFYPIAYTVRNYFENWNWHGDKHRPLSAIPRENIHESYWRRINKKQR